MREMVRLLDPSDEIVGWAEAIDGHAMFTAPHDMVVARAQAGDRDLVLAWSPVYLREGDRLDLTIR